MLRSNNFKTIASVTIGICICVLEFKLALAEAQNQTDTVSNSEGKFVHKVNNFASRMLWLTHDRKFMLPNGTLLTIAPSVTIPVFRPNQKPFKGGLNSDIKASWYFYMDFSKLGMAGDQHPWPLDFSRPPFYPFGELMRINPVTPTDKDNKDKNKDKDASSARPPKGQNYNKKPDKPGQNNNENHHFAGIYFDPQFRYKRQSQNVRRKRSILSLPPPESIHGGERAILMPTLEGVMNNLGFEGRACLLRAVCEIHEYPLQHGYGLFGEMITLFFSISYSSYADSHMPEYLKAENKGRLEGDCSSYHKNCTKSIFKWEKKERPKILDAESTNEV